MGPPVSHRNGPRVIPSFSFAGCGFLGVYHVGVAACLKQHTDAVDMQEIKFLGSSAGALVSSCLLCDVDLSILAKMLLETARVVRSCEKTDLAQMLRDVLDHYMPVDAHLKLRGRMHICVTQLNGMKKAIITNFRSREHLLDCLICTSFVPGFLGFVPPKLDEKYWLSAMKETNETSDTTIQKSPLHAPVSFLDLTEDLPDRDFNDSDDSDDGDQFQPDIFLEVPLYADFLTSSSEFDDQVTEGSGIQRYSPRSKSFSQTQCQIHKERFRTSSLPQKRISADSKNCTCGQTQSVNVNTIFSSSQNLNPNTNSALRNETNQSKKTEGSKRVKFSLGPIRNGNSSSLSMSSVSEGRSSEPQSSNDDSRDQRFQQIQQKLADAEAERDELRAKILSQQQLKVNQDKDHYTSCDKPTDKKDHESSEDEESDEEDDDYEAPSLLKLTRAVINPNTSKLNKLFHVCHYALQTSSTLIKKLPGGASLVGRFEVVENIVEELLLYMMDIKPDEKFAWDGGFSDNIPELDLGTITICPFSGEADICPRDLTGMDFNLDVGRTSIHFSEDNLYRVFKALDPMDPELLMKLCDEGYNDCLKYLYKNDLLSCRTHFLTRASIARSPCNIGHAHCHCQSCQAGEMDIRVALMCVQCSRVKKKALGSFLPENIRKEFEVSIRNFNCEKARGLNPEGWIRLKKTIFRAAETMFSRSVQAAELALDFSNWLLRFFDTLWSVWSQWCDFTSLKVQESQKLITAIIASLQSFIIKSYNIRHNVALPPVMMFV